MEAANTDSGIRVMASSGSVRGRVLCLCRYWLPVIGCMAFIFWLSSRQSFPSAPWIGDFDKALHAVEYGFLSLLTFRAFYRASPLADRRLRAWLAGALLAVVYAASDEFHQSFVPGRSADSLDLLADAAGVLLAGSLVPLYDVLRRLMIPPCLSR